MCHLDANELINEGQGLLEVEFSTFLSLVGSNQFSSYLQWLCHSFKGCTLPSSLLSQVGVPVTQLVQCIEIKSLGHGKCAQFGCS